VPDYASRGAVPFLLHYVGRQWQGHAVVLIAVLAAVGCAIGSQYAVKQLVDVLGWQFPLDRDLWFAVATLLALVAGDNLLWRLAGWVAAKAFVELGGDLRLDLFEHLSGQSPKYFAERFPGALAGRISTAASAALTIENSVTWNTIPPAAAVVSSIIVLGLVNWHLMVTLAAVSIVLGLIIRHFAARGRHLRDRYAARAASVSGDVMDIIGNIGLVRAFGAARRERDRLSQIIGNEMAAQSDSLRSLERLRLFHAGSVFLVTAGVLAWSIILWRAQRITTGDVVLATTLGFTVLHASRDFAMAMVDLLQQLAKLDEAVRVLGLPHEMPDAPNAQPLINLGGSISFLNVCFSYPEGERVLHDFTLHVPAGQKIGLVGRSGAGKSTVLALLQRLYDPEHGQVLIDEQDITGVTQNSLHRAIAVVQQDISLFHRSIGENLRYAMPEASDEMVRQAAAAAHCIEFINRLPQGFDTIVGERGAKLSGGQRQRIAIARAFICNAPIILLDEATSALDSESERFVQDALNRLLKRRTVVAIAHRLSSLSAFDRIIVLERGYIVEDGPPSDLLRQNGVYSRLYTQQHGEAGRK
jgi:ATP-binding cassette subfamily B protein